MNAQHDNSKRKFLKTTAYLAPMIMTLKVTPSIANSGSTRKTSVLSTPGDPNLTPAGHADPHHHHHHHGHDDDNDEDDDHD